MCNYLSVNSTALQQVENTFDWSSTCSVMTPVCAHILTIITLLGLVTCRPFCPTENGRMCNELSPAASQTDLLSQNNDNIQAYQERTGTVSQQSSHSNSNVNIHNLDKNHTNGNVPDASNDDDEESDNDTQYPDRKGPNENVRELSKDKPGKHKELKRSSSGSTMFVDKLLMLMLLFAVNCL